MRSGLHGAPAKPVPGGDHENMASTPTRLDSDYDCARVGEQVTIYDSMRDRMVIFGGDDGSYFGEVNDVWALSLAGAPSWSALAGPVQISV